MRALLVTMIAAAACAAPKPSPATPANHDVPAGAVDALAAAALRRSALDPNDRRGALPASGPIVVLLDVDRPQALVLGAAAIPTGLARPFVGRRRAEVQADVDRTHRPISFVYFEQLEVTGARGRVQLETGRIAGRPDPADQLFPDWCTSAAVDEYEWRDGAWQLVGTGPSRCRALTRGWGSP